MVKSRFTKILSLLLLAFGGCGALVSEGPFGPPVHSELLSPYAGRWTFDFEKTLAAMKSFGSTDDDIANARRLYSANPGVLKMHEDLTIQGNEAVGNGLPSCEYDFFLVHRHGSKLCGKAWHHEDRFDPGDMSKCYVKLSFIEKNLCLEVDMLEETSSEDPELLSMPPVEGGLSNCEADKQKPKKWMIFVFTRGS